MKKCILCALLPILCFLTFFAFPLRTHTASAQTQTTPSAGGYACILTDSTYFYATRDEKRGVFLLPKTYFVKVLDVSDDFCKIEYLYDDTYAKKLVGYAKTQELTFVDFIPEHPYLYYLIEVSYHIGEENGLNDGFLNNLVVTCTYYGDFKIGSETYCYVLRGDEFGYIPKPTNLSYVENTEYQDHLTPAPTPEPPQADTATPEPTSSPAQIAILIALCILVPLLAALILKPPHRPPYESDD